VPAICGASEVPVSTEVKDQVQLMAHGLNGASGRHVRGLAVAAYNLLTGLAQIRLPGMVADLALEAG